MSSWETLLSVRQNYCIGWKYHKIDWPVQCHYIFPFKFFDIHPKIPKCIWGAYIFALVYSNLDHQKKERQQAPQYLTYRKTLVSMTMTEVINIIF